MKRFRQKLLQKLKRKGKESVKDEEIIKLVDKARDRLTELERTNEALSASLATVTTFVLILAIATIVYLTSL